MDGKTHRCLDLNIRVDLLGSRKARLYIEELSDQLLLVNLWFFGCESDAEEWDQKGIRNEDKPAFLALFNLTASLINPILGSIAYEEDAREFFPTQEASPHSDYRIENLSFDFVRKVMEERGYEFEYCWLDPTWFGEGISQTIPIHPAFRIL